MSAYVAIFCNGRMEYGTCPKQFTVGTQDVAKAFAVMVTKGWRKIGDRDLCPECARAGR